MYLINGKRSDVLAVNDRGLQFGDGGFTTARIIHGKIVHLPEHLARLRALCQRLAIPFSQWDALEQEMRNAALPQAEAVLKVILTRGSGGRGYSTTGCVAPTRIVHIAPYPPHYARWRRDGITLALSPVRLGRNPYLAGMKHLNRLEQVLIRSHLEQTDADEALVLDSEGWVTECCAANLFWRKGQDVFTPRLDQAGVNGIMRQHIIAQLAASPYQLIEVVALPEALADADEVLICNALIPLAPVQHYAGLDWPSRELYQYLAPLCELSD
ncbi:aminodeoxychorismate lyase [Pseudocitrobacter corydidari]